MSLSVNLLSLPPVPLSPQSLSMTASISSPCPPPSSTTVLRRRFRTPSPCPFPDRRGRLSADSSPGGSSPRARCLWLPRRSTTRRITGFRRRRTRRTPLMAAETGSLRPSLVCTAATVLRMWFGLQPLDHLSDNHLLWINQWTLLIWRCVVNFVSLIVGIFVRFLSWVVSLDVMLLLT